MNNFLCDEKNIDSIFFYAINNDLNCLVLHYTANHKKYKKDYKDIDFKESVLRIKKVYNVLKDKNKIELIGDLTKDIISGRINVNSNTIYNKTILDTDNYDYLSMFDYIKFIIKHTLNLLDINMTYFVGNKVRYRYEPLDFPNRPLDHYEIPITFYKTDKGYKLKYRIYKDKKDYVFDSDISVFDKSIIVKINNNEYNGEIIFDKLNIDNEVSFKKDDKNIYYKHYDNTLNEEDKEKIKKVFEMLDINFEIDGIKTMDNNYILYNSKDEYDYYIKLSIYNDLISVKLKYYNKYKKKDLSFRADEEHYDILITKYNDEYLLIQQKYLMSLNGSNEFKQNINKSRYFILKRDTDNLNIIDSKILKKEEVLTKLEKMNDIDKLILKRG